jgi:hypothetical protein
MPPIITNQPRKDAPAAMISKPYVDERTLLVERTKKQLGVKAKGMHFFFGDANIAKTGRYADEGYVPCGTDHRGDPLFMRPIDKHKAHLEEAADVSKSAYVAAKNGEGSEYETRTADGNVLRPIKEE